MAWEVICLLAKIRYQSFEFLQLTHILRCRHLILVLNAVAAQAYYTTASPIVTQFPGQGCVDDLTTESSYGLQNTWVIDVLDLLYLNMLSMVVFSTRHWSGRLEQEINASTEDHFYQL